MNSVSQGGGPAFPPLTSRKYDNFGDKVAPGISRREWFATHAPISMKEAWSIWTDHKKRTMADTLGAASEREPFLQWFASLRYEYADAMLRETAGED